MIERRTGSIVLAGSMTGKRALYGRTLYAASTALGRVVENREVVDAALFLASENATAITGEDLNVRPEQ